MFGKKAVIIGAVLVLTLAGFVLGQAVNAAIGSPGDQNDPLVTKSYVDIEAGKLQVQIDELTNEADTLRGEIAGLRSEIDKLK
ncbi:hypothetical protein [Phosphitispora fastidiosa]|uniref:hypothetical protein n=1 Tax=Phosphitispora fastidiosa TaxID=2837202 RepID=UPI001E47009A|nr:hypothetical protein [Phosphitispora fastidiosa]MBU7008157.1 peptidoglycan hydrolase CwlO-like protein [Phosphitispora fastidiosa]